MTWSRIIAILAALAGAGSGIAGLLGELNPKAALIVTIASTFIAIFCERIQGGASKMNVLIVMIVASAVFMTGCPKGQRTVRQLREKSAELAVYGTKIVTAFGDAYRAGEITQDQLRTLNTATGAFTTGLGAYRDALAEAERIVRESGEVPAGTIQTLERVLDDRVIAAFFDILAKVGVLPLSQSEVIKTILSGIRLTILSIRGAFSDARKQLNLPEVKHGYSQSLSVSA